MSNTSRLEFACPHCGSHELASLDVVEATAAITGWSKSADGVLEPQYEGRSDVHWDTQAAKDAEKPYTCTSCDSPLGASELVPAVAAEDLLCGCGRLSCVEIDGRELCEDCHADVCGAGC